MPPRSQNQDDGTLRVRADRRSAHGFDDLGGGSALGLSSENRPRGAAFGLVANLAAGAGLLMALRAALTHAGWEMTILWLLVALAAHVADLASRWR
jgi:hypothetical protein